MSPSPFIPYSKLQYAWDSTSLGWLKECPRKYQYHMVEGWVGRGEAVHLEFGIYYHTALETFDKYLAQGLDRDAALLRVVRETLSATWRDGKPWRAARDLSSDDKTSLKCRENLIRTIVWYIDHFKDDPAQTRHQPNGAPMVELHFQFNLDFQPQLNQPYVL